MMSPAVYEASMRATSGFLSELNPGLVWSAALLAAAAYATRSARLSGLDPRSMYWAVVCAILGGLWGGHLMGVFVHGWRGALSLFEFWDGAKSLYGGLLGGGLAAAIFFCRRRLPILKFADAAMPALALGYSVGRVGCFLNGDDFGTVSQAGWAVVFPPATEAYAEHVARGWISQGAAWSLPVHPVQLYASFLGLMLFLLLAWFRPRKPGDRLCAFLVLYGTARFFMEYLRGDFHPVLGLLSLPQVFSVAFVCAGFGIWLCMNARFHPADQARTSACAMSAEIAHSSE